MLFFLFLFRNKAICKDCFDQTIPELPLTPESVAESNPEIVLNAQNNPYLVKPPKKTVAKFSYQKNPSIISNT